MPRKKDQDSTPGAKLLRLFRKLMLDGGKHYLSELAEWLNCSPQTIMRLIHEIDIVTGLSLESGMDSRRRWYRLNLTASRRLGAEFEEARYLGLCRDFAGQMLPGGVLDRIDKSLFRLALAVTEENSRLDKTSFGQLPFFRRGRIDYSPHRDVITKLLSARAGRLVCRVRSRDSAKLSDEGRERVFAPGKIIVLNNTLFALGAELNEDKSFKFWTNILVHRVVRLDVTDEEYVLDIPEPDPNSFGFPYFEAKTYSIRFHPGSWADFVRERVWADEQKIEDENNGGFILTITTRDEPELMSWVSSFGSNCELLRALPSGVS